MFALLLSALITQNQLPSSIRHQRQELPVHHNVLMIVLDDVGIDQLAVYDSENHYTDPLGYAYAYTPNIDALAASGVTFTRARANPLCSPTRASLLAGAYPHVTGCGTNVANDVATASFREFNVAPSPIHTLLPDMFIWSGYGDVFAVGKWHLAIDASGGGSMDGHPVDIGFDSWEGHPRNLKSPPGPPGPFEPGYYNYFWGVSGGTRINVVGQHSADRIADKAVAQIGAAIEPWFAFVNFASCHTPLNKQNWPSSAEHGFGPVPPGGVMGTTHVNTRLRATLESADFQIGRLLAAAPADTTVVFLGDNGTRGEVLDTPTLDVRYPSGHPLHMTDDETTLVDTAPYDVVKFKSTAYEGGVRMPLIVRHESAVSPGSTVDRRTDVVDVFRSLADLEVLVLPTTVAPDSQSFAGWIDGTDTTERAFSLSEEFSPNGTSGFIVSVIRSYVTDHLGTEYKIVQTGPSAFEFYDLDADPMEDTDLGTGHAAYATVKAAMDLELL